eukprot:scpid87134/ scgid21846/ 
MADDDSIFTEARQNLFGDGFYKKAKERDDEMRVLNSVAASKSARPISSQLLPRNRAVSRATSRFFTGTPAIPVEDSGDEDGTSLTPAIRVSATAAARSPRTVPSDIQLQVQHTRSISRTRSVSS